MLTILIKNAAVFYVFFFFWQKTTRGPSIGSLSMQLIFYKCTTTQCNTLANFCLFFICFFFLLMSGAVFLCSSFQLLKITMSSFSSAATLSVVAAVVTVVLWIWLATHSQSASSAMPAIFYVCVDSVVLLCRLTFIKLFYSWHDAALFPFFRNNLCKVKSFFFLAQFCYYANFVFIGFELSFPQK